MWHTLLAVALLVSVITVTCVVLVEKRVARGVSIAVVVIAVIAVVLLVASETSLFVYGKSVRDDMKTDSDRPSSIKTR